MFRRLLYFSFILGLIVVILGTYTRLSDAGLGCPDWPTCYGRFVVPNLILDENGQIKKYQKDWQVKAWIEMIHRYAASFLGLILIMLVIIAFHIKKTNRRHIKKQSKKLVLILLGLVLLQGILGMLTVTELLHPVIVVLHLVFAMAMVSLIFWILLNENKPAYSDITFAQNIIFPKIADLLIWVTLIVLVMQIILGGWTSANYAALACGNFFPTCLNSWLPEITSFSEAILPLQPLGINYEYGALENGERIAIQLLHRTGALIVFITIIALAFSLRLHKTVQIQLITMLALLILQISLGILNIILSLPIIIALAHNIVALLLLLSLISIVHIRITSKIKLTREQ